MTAFLGCQTRYWHLHEPPPIPCCNYSDKPICVALVLGGGGARGLAHLGVIEVLEEEGIPIDYIVGCSAGSLIGALYAHHPSAGDLKRSLMALKAKHLLKANFLNFRFGFLHGNGIRCFVQKHLGYRCFEDLKIPFTSVATDLRTGELVCFNKGLVLPTIHASCAVPLYFTPVQLYGRTLVDGGVVDPVPVRVARESNPEIVIAVDVSGTLSKTRPSHLLGVAARGMEIMYIEHIKNCAKDADVLIRPQLDDFGFFEEGSNQQIYQAGRRAAKEMLPKIRELMDQYQKTSCNNQ